MTVPLFTNAPASIAGMLPVSSNVAPDSIVTVPHFEVDKADII